MADLTFDDLIPSGGASAPAQGGGDLSFDDLVPNELSMRERSEQNLKPIREEAWRTTKEMAGHAWENLKGGLAPRESSPDEGFWEGYGKDLASAPGRFGKFATGVIEAPMVPLAPAIGAAKSIIGRPMAHGIHKIGEYLNPEVAAKQTPEGIYQDIREDVGSAVQTVLPAKWKSEMPLPGRPRVPENAPPNVRDAVQKRIDALPPEEPADVSPALRDWLDQPPQSPMTAREGIDARLLPHDYAGNARAGDPHYDAAWEGLGGARSAGASGVPGGPLAGVHPEAIKTMRDIIREEGLSPWELERRQEEERSPHHFGGEWSDAMRNEVRGLNSLGGEGANIIGQAVRARRREAPERMRGHLRDFFGDRLDAREEAANRKQAQEQAQPFWREFNETPVPPTPELAALDDALKAAGAWKGAETMLRMERVPRENHFVELPNTGEHVMANPSLPSETIRVPTSRFYQAAKRHLDRRIDAAMAAPGGADEVGVLVGLKKALTDAIDNHPDPTVRDVWRRARDASTPQKEWESAVALGRRVMTEHVEPGDFAMLWDTLSDQEKLGVRKGSHEKLGLGLGRVGNADINTMKQILGDNNQQKLRIMEGEAGAAERLIGNAEHELGMASGPLTGPNTADKLAAQKRYQPKETFWQSAKPSEIGHPSHWTGLGLKKGMERLQAKSREKAQAEQNQINADIARLMTLQGPEWNAVVRYLHGVEPTEPSPGTGPRPSPRPAPARPAGDVEPPPPSQVPEGPPGYPQPEMTAVEATQVLRDFGYDQATINRMGGATRMATAQHLQASYPKGPPAKTPDFPGEVTPHEPAPPAAAARPVESAPVPAEKPLSLLEWIRKQGGISPDDPLAGDVRAMFGGKNPGGIIRKGGKHLDRLREGAVGEKYFLDKGDIEGGEAATDVNTLLDAMVLEADGQKQYPLGSEVGEVRNKDVEARNQEQRRDLEFSPEARRLDRELAQHGVTRDMMPTDVRQRAVDMLRSGIERDPVEAFEKAMNEKLKGDLEAERAAEIGEGLEPSPQSHGMAARGNRAAPQGQSGTGQDVRGAGARDRAEKEPLERKTLAKRMVSIYNAPDKGPRHFGEDYRGATANDSQAGATLSHAISGEPLTAPHVAGRRRVGGFDEPISPADYETLTKTATGRSTQYLHPSEMGGDAGQVELHPLTRRVERVNIDKTLSPEKMAMVRAHELGHVVDQMAGEIPVTGLAGELQGIYNTLNNGNRAKGGMEAAAWGKPMTPKGMGYKGVHVAREYMAEAIRAYMTNPNYLKSVAPRVAARIRQYVNSHPELMKIIQFNMLALGMLPWDSIGKALPFATGGAVNRASGGRVDASAINSNPSEAQKEVGNYAKDHIHIHGLDITIENAKGSKRSGVDKGGKPWSVALPAHYGYIKKSEGADGDHVDCYIGPHIKASKVYVIDQKDAQTGKFDEHKCFIGFASAKHARNCYLKAFSDGKGADRLGAMHEADIDGFKAWLAAGDTTKPIGKIAA